MGSISLKLSDDTLKTSVYCAKVMQISRAEFIRRAIDKMNREIMAGIRAERLAQASVKAREESMRINAEFDAVEKDLEA